MAAQSFRWRPRALTRLVDRREQGSTKRIDGCTIYIISWIVLEMQFLPQAPVQCCLVLPGVVCSGAPTGRSTYSQSLQQLTDTMNNNVRLQHPPGLASQPVLQHLPLNAEHSCQTRHASACAWEPLRRMESTSSFTQVSGSCDCVAAVLRLNLTPY